MTLREKARSWCRWLVSRALFRERRARLKLTASDRRQNRRWRGADQRFLVVRCPWKNPLVYEIVLKWTAANFPDERRRFELRSLPLTVSDWSPYRLHIPWLSDPVRSWSPSVFNQAHRLAVECERYRVPVVNRVSTTENATRARAAELLRIAGVPMPRTVPVGNVDEFAENCRGIPFPLFIREGFGHGREFYRVERAADLSRVPWHTLKQPVATEIVDVRDPRDGLYRKFRYLAAGSWGCLLHIQFSKNWVTRGKDMILNETLIQEELENLDTPDSNHERLQRARRALGLDFVAFDYGYDRRGQLIVWEANPLPFLHFGSAVLLHRRPTMHRILAAMLCMYLSKADLPVPTRVTDLMGSGRNQLEPALAGLQAVVD